MLNYCFGGRGFESSWGVADEVLKLVADTGVVGEESRFSIFLKRSFQQRTLK